jgi:hypothetical protein
MQSNKLPENNSKTLLFRCFEEEEVFQSTLEDVVVMFESSLNVACGENHQKNVVLVCRHGKVKKSSAESLFRATYESPHVNIATSSGKLYRLFKHEKYFILGEISIFVSVFADLLLEDLEEKIKITKVKRLFKSVFKSVSQSALSSKFRVKYTVCLLVSFTYLYIQNGMSCECNLTFIQVIFFINETGMWYIGWSGNSSKRQLIEAATHRSGNSSNAL